MKEVILSPCALCDADQSREWYEKREAGLGYDFIHALDEACSRISREPDSSRVVSGQIQRCMMRRFPFNIIFEVRDDCIWVYAVFHTSRNPEDLTKRIE